MSSYKCIRTGWLAVGLSCGLTAPAAWALTDFTPYVAGGIQHNSNVFGRSADDPPLAAQGNTQLGDTIYDYLGGANLDLAWDRDRLRLNGEATRYEYNRFDGLDHTEYKFGGLFDWHLGPVVDGSVRYDQSRVMSALQDTLSDVLEMQKDRTASATVRVLVTPRWRVDLTPKWHEADTPLEQFPEFGVHETSGAASLNYVGIDKLTAGVQVEYTNGNFEHIVSATRYHQTTGELTATYSVNGFSAFDGELGYTVRNSSLINPADAAITGTGAAGRTTALTGLLRYRRQLSVKTSVYAQLFRNVESYTAGANSEIGTGGDAGVTWDPDSRFEVTLHYRQERQSIQGDLAIANFTDRVDTLRSGQIEVKYHVRQWLTLRPYFNRNSRSSNFAEASYNASIVGVDLTAKWQ